MSKEKLPEASQGGGKLPDSSISPTEQFRESVESALDRVWENGYGTSSDELPPDARLAEALASIQASTVLLLESLKKEQYGDAPIWVAQSEVDKLIRELKQ